MRAVRKAGYIGQRQPMVALEMQLSEFREHVEWLEELRPEDGCTKDWRRQLDELDPAEEEAS